MLNGVNFFCIYSPHLKIIPLKQAYGIRRTKIPAAIQECLQCMEGFNISFLQGSDVHLFGELEYGDVVVVNEFLAGVEVFMDGIRSYVDGSITLFYFFSVVFSNRYLTIISPYLDI